MVEYRPVAELLKTPDPEAPSITEDADLKKIVSNVVVKVSSFLLYYRILT